jgi:hypothetical protein
MPRLFLFARAPQRNLALFVALALTGVTVSRAVERATGVLPLALRGVDPDRLSSGLYAALVSEGAFGPVPAAAIAEEQISPLADKGAARAILDPRVGPNLRLGADPAELSFASRHQA